MPSHKVGRLWTFQQSEVVQWAREDAVLPLSRFTDLAIEGELALELSKEPCEKKFSTGGAR